ncbi:carboxymuconolactone decarboxylase family protein [Tianweitania populi]|uniref:Alkyl hydroperoxide reductase AhpD n=1 Tax=Tianweitania populi TaxID=1607949 RepID=A0A8J3GMG6_9HYPH|nr:carboxymuconolactone decarboxylase family protein [Tianweitania populi]GHD23109.1 alkyl hydroperoxide reductase AhpD [Tianweitania populi]
MSRLELRTIENAPEEAKPLLTKAEASNGFLPNLLRVLANAPTALEAYLTLGGINGRASLSLAEREVVQITAAAIHGCGFCVAGHTAVATKKAGLDAGTVEALRSRNTIENAKLDAVARFTEAVIAGRGAVVDAELKTFKSAGYDDQAALEVVLGVSLATLCNFANNLGQPPLNEQLQQFAWTNRAQAAE